MRVGEGCSGFWEFFNFAIVYGGVRWEGAVGFIRYAFFV